MRRRWCPPTPPKATPTAIGRERGRKEPSHPWTCSSVQRFPGSTGDLSVAGGLGSEVPRPPSNPAVDVQRSSDKGLGEDSLPQVTGLRSAPR